MVCFLQNKINGIYNLLKNREEQKLKEAVFLPKISRSIQLNNYTCAPHSVYVIVNFFNDKTTLKEIIDELKTEKKGTDTDPIIDFLKKHGYNVEINTAANLQDIKEAINFSKPLLITIDEWEHWCVVYGYTKDSILILNSWFNRFSVEYPLSEFLERWDDNWFAAISKKL